MKRQLPLRAKDSHKGDYGHVLVVAGSDRMTGAAALVVRGALRAGAGLVSLASTPAGREVVRFTLPEAMTLSFREVLPYIRKRRITTLAVGPGLGVGIAQRRLIERLLRLRLPTVLDADGLNNLRRPARRRGESPCPLIVTPHEGEMARLWRVSTDQVHRGRERFVRQTAVAFGGICVLKGHRTLVSDGQRLYVNRSGNPAMAAGGMGDVLTGILSGFLAQGVSLWQAAVAGVYFHGRAADRAAKGDRGLLAHEVADALPEVL